jgi:L-threonylcarbamoyladenylate synthase
MKTRVILLDPTHPHADGIDEAARVLRAGGLVAFPTETVYGLGANALDASAVERIFWAKGRPTNNPLIVHVTEAERVREVAAAWPESAARLAERFWPGPLTLVLPKRALVPDAVTAGGPTVAVRVPAHPLAQALLRAAAVPVAAPSANRSMELSPTRAEHVLRGLDGRIDVLLDGGPTAGGIESTVLDVTANPPRLLRPGLISVAELEAVIGPLTHARSFTVADRDMAQALPSPGMLPRHYAPRTPLECVERDDTERIASLIAEGYRVGWVTFAAIPQVESSAVLVRVLPSDPAGYASQMYAVLHKLDALGLDRIVVTLPPDNDDWLAVRDRLRRAQSN